MSESTFDGTTTTEQSTYIYAQICLSRNLIILHTTPGLPQDTQYPWIRPKYRTTKYPTNPPEDSNTMMERELTQLQRICRTSLYYIIGVYSTIIMEINTLPRRKTYRK